MKTSALFLSLFALGSLAAAIPIENEAVGGVAEVMAGRAVNEADVVPDTVFHGVSCVGRRRVATANLVEDMRYSKRRKWYLQLWRRYRPLWR